MKTIVLIVVLMVSVTIGSSAQNYNNNKNAVHYKRHAVSGHNNKMVQHRTSVIHHKSMDKRNLAAVHHRTTRHHNLLVAHHRNIGRHRSQACNTLGNVALIAIPANSNTSNCSNVSSRNISTGYSENGQLNVNRQGTFTGYSPESSYINQDLDQNRTNAGIVPTDYKVKNKGSYTGFKSKGSYTGYSTEFPYTYNTQAENMTNAGVGSSNYNVTTNSSFIGSERNSSYTGYSPELSYENQAIDQNMTNAEPTAGANCGRRCNAVRTKANCGRNCNTVRTRANSTRSCNAGECGQRHRRRFILF